MSPADIAALRAMLCKVHARLGAGLLHLEDVESYASADSAALASASMDSALDDLEGAAAHLHDVITAADCIDRILAPKGEDPFRISKS
jgi:hypothetical protein